jgi:hypothetical protein
MMLDVLEINGSHIRIDFTQILPHEIEGTLEILIK